MLVFNPPPRHWGRILNDAFDRVNNLIAKANVDPLDLAYIKLPFDLWDQSKIDTLNYGIDPMCSEPT